MNEALKPDDVTQRSAPATVETARPRRRSLLLRIAIVAALAAAAVFAWQKFEHIAPSTHGGRKLRPITGSRRRPCAWRR